MADRVYTTQADSGVTQDFDGGWHTLGVELRLSAPGKLVGGRCRYPASDPANFAWGFWRLSDQALLATIDLDAFFGAGAANSAWNSFVSSNFTTPGDVTGLLPYPSESYVVAQGTNGDFLYKNSGVSYPIGSGGIVSGVQARFIDSGSGLTFPTGTNTTDWLFADVEIELDETYTPGFYLHLPKSLLLKMIAARVAQFQAGEQVTTFTQEPTDNMGLVDSATFDVSSVVTDNMGLVDSVGLALATPFTDNMGLTDSAGLTLETPFTDSMGLTDSATAEVAKTVAATDDMGLVDAATFAVAMPVTDNMGLVDSAGLDVAKPFTDSMGLTDSATTQVSHPLDATDDMGLTDSSLLEVYKAVGATDSMGLTDSATFGVGGAVTDNMGLVDNAGLAFARPFTDSMGLTDSISVTTASAFTDSMGLTDTAGVVPVKHVDATDSMGLTDEVTTQSGAGSVILPAGLVPVRTFTQDEIVVGNRFTRFRFDLFTRDEAALGNLAGVQPSGGLDLTASSAVHAGGSMDIVDLGQSIDWLNYRVRPVIVIEGLPEEPLGMYVFPESPEDWSGTGRIWNVKLLDKTSLLDQTKVPNTYALDVGTVVTDAIVDLIESIGETNHAITPSAATLSAPLVWDPATTKLRIVNDLLAVINYFSLFCDGTGQYRGEPYTRPAVRPLRYEFLDGAKSIYSPNFKRDIDNYSVPNRVIVVGQGDGTTEALVATATNEDPNSRYSYQSRGETWIDASETGIEAPDQATLDAYARRRLIELTSVTVSIPVTHAYVPGLTFNDVVKLRNTPAGINALHVITNTNISFDPTALAKSTLREVVDL